MAFCGLGLGMAMPILNLAVQNEFEQKDLGAATSSVQLFRGLGSTVGTAVLSGLLTTGIISAIGNPDNLPYVQTLKQSPAAQQILGDEITADTLLRVNAQEQVITEGLKQGVKEMSLPVQAQEALVTQVSAQQKDFRVKLIDSFTVSLHQIFLVSSLLMATGLVLVTFIKERPLRGGVKLTPGE